MALEKVLLFIASYHLKAMACSGSHVKEAFCGQHKRMSSGDLTQTFLGLLRLRFFPYMKLCSALRMPGGLQHRTSEPKELSSPLAPHLPLSSTKACRTSYLHCSKQVELTCRFQNLPLSFFGSLILANRKCSS